MAVAVSGFAGITVVIVLVRVPLPWLQFGAHPDARVQLENFAPGAVAVATRVTVVPEAYQPPAGGASVMLPELAGSWAVVRKYCAKNVTGTLEEGFTPTLPDVLLVTMY